MFTKFGVITQPFIKSTIAKNTSMLELILFYNTRADKKSYRLLSFVI